MEETHQKKIEDLQRQHQRELEKLREEKDRLLAEETAATISGKWGHTRGSPAMGQLRVDGDMRMVFAPAWRSRAWGGMRSRWGSWREASGMYVYGGHLSPGPSPGLMSLSLAVTQSGPSSVPSQKGVNCCHG